MRRNDRTFPYRGKLRVVGLNNRSYHYLNIYNYGTGFPYADILLTICMALCMASKPECRQSFLPC